MQQASSRRDIVIALQVFALACLLQLPLALNPGYYSHDELQWAAFAADGILPSTVAAQRGLTRAWLMQVQMDSSRARVVHALLSQGATPPPPPLETANNICPACSLCAACMPLAPQKSAARYLQSVLEGI